MKNLILVIILLSCTHKVVRNYSKDEIKHESVRVNAFFEKAFQEQVDRYPQFQTYLGIKKDSHLLNDISEEMNLKELKISKKLLTELEQFDYNQLDTNTQLSYRLFKEDLEFNIRNFEFHLHDYPVNQMFGAHSDLPSFMINQHTISNEKDAQDYISRLNLFKNHFDQLIINLELRKKKKIIAPKFVYPKTIQDCKNMISGFPFENTKKLSPLYEDFNNKIKKFSKASKISFGKSLIEALQNSVRPGYENLINKLTELEKIAPLEGSALSLPDGEDFYDYQLLKHTTTYISADGIHELGLKEVERIQNEMKKIMETVKFKGDLKSFFEFIKTSKQFSFPDTPEGKNRYLKMSKLIITNIEKKLPQMFSTFPKIPMEVKPVEPFREQSAGTAFYEPPSEDGKRPGVYFVNLFDMTSIPNYEIEALAYHEGIPGHHMQIAIATELNNIPRFRRHHYYNAYTEGWGLYAENFPKDFGFYTDPFSDFGRLSMELWRAARLVVDTGLHSKKWSMEKAIKWLDENTPSAHEENVRGIQRYVVMPGQATSYKIGMNKIMELKQLAKNQLGKKFDIRSFHDEVLKDGSVPLHILEEKIHHWMRLQK